jgi:hypothetical protein
MDDEGTEISSPGPAVGSPSVNVAVSPTASTPGAPTKSIAGYLLKKSTEGSWQRRYFETSGHFLTYYKSQKMTKLLAALALPQVGDIQYVGMVEDGKGTGAIFQLDLKDRQYVLRADDEETAKRWVDTLIILRDSEVAMSPSPSPMKPSGPATISADGVVSAPAQGIGRGKPIPTPGDEARFMKDRQAGLEDIADGCCTIS